MDLNFDIAAIATLASDVATYGTLRVGELVTDEVFDFIVGAVELVYEQSPDPR